MEVCRETGKAALGVEEVGVNQEYAAMAVFVNRIAAADEAKKRL